MKLTFKEWLIWLTYRIFEGEVRAFQFRMQIQWERDKNYQTIYNKGNT